MGDWDDAVPSFVVERGKASKMQTIADLLTAFTGPPTSYPVTWSVHSGTAPAINNGTLTGEYWRLDRFALAIVYLQSGNTTTFGGVGGIWRFSLPVAAANTRGFGAGWCLDAGTLRRGGASALIVAGDLSNMRIATNSGDVTQASPHTWANPDELLAGIIYTAA